MRKTLIFNFDGFFVPRDTKEELARCMLEDEVKSKHVLYACGLPTYILLKGVKFFDSKGLDYSAERAAELAYIFYDFAIKGVDPEYVKDFAKGYASEFSKEGKEALMELKDRNHEIYLASGGIQECTERILGENQVYDIFDGICCNRLVLDEDGNIQKLEKRTSTPRKKAAVLKENGVDLRNSIAIGHSYWERELFKEAYPIAFDLGSWAGDSALEIAKERGKIVSGFGEMMDVLKKL